MSQPSAMKGKWRFRAILASWLLAVAAGLGWNGIRESLDDSPRAAKVLPPVDASAFAEVTLPEGPHAEAFRVSCLTCHSSRLPLNQPTFGEAKWTELVHKMVAAYGAPITPDTEPKIVAYLLSTQTGR